MTLVEQFVRRYARRITRNGETVLTTNDDALLLAAFKELGWSDPYQDPAPAEKHAPSPTEKADPLKRGR